MMSVLTRPTIAMQMEHVLMFLVHLLVLVIPDLLEMELLVLMTTNTLKRLITALSTRTVLILQGPSLAHVMQAIQVTVFLALIMTNAQTIPIIVIQTPLVQILPDLLHVYAMLVTVMIIISGYRVNLSRFDTIIVAYKVEIQKSPKS